MRLIDVYEGDIERNALVLYKLLQERQPHESISHKAMPTWEQHCAFVESRPYAAWYIVQVEPLTVGAVYLSKQREVGVGIFRNHQGTSYGERAVRELMRLHPGRFLANINPHNHASIRLFQKLGFGGPIQITLERTE